VVEHLLCKHKALSSNPGPTKKNKKRKKVLVASGDGELIPVIKFYPSILSFLKSKVGGLQGNCRRECKMETGMPSFSPAFS
jgi:hypothetical protein